MKKYITSILALAVLSCFPACTEDFDLLNTNPNAPTNVSTTLMLPKVQQDLVNTVVGESWGIGNIVIQHTSKNQFVNEDRYLWGELNSIWNMTYANARHIRNIVNQSEALGQNNYLGIALVLKSWMFSLCTDAYGDIPYADATKAKDGINQPKYDTQESVYQGILADLSKANSILGTSGEVVAGDLIFAGDVMKWKKLANSLRIRALMRISAKRNVSAELKAILDNPVQSPIMAGNADNATYRYLATSPDQFPLFTTRIGSFNEFRASKTLLDILASLGDKRLEIFFRPTPATESASTPVYAGLPNGLSDVDALTFNGGPQNQSRVGSLFYENAVSPQGLNTARGVIMTFAELSFLLAEAAEKGLVSGSAETFYLNGIKASMQYYGLTATDAYLAQANVAYTGTQQQKLVKIGTQKWIGLFYMGLEAWFDWRRTGIPALKAGPSNQNSDRIPVRFIYPISEQALNSASYQAAVQRQGTDNINTRMWIIK